MGEIKNSYNTLVGEPEEKRPQRRCRCRWDDNTKINLGKHGGKTWTGCIWVM